MSRLILLSRSIHDMLIRLRMMRGICMRFGRVEQLEYLHGHIAKPTCTGRPINSRSPTVTEREATCSKYSRVVIIVCIAADHVQPIHMNHFASLLWLLLPREKKRNLLSIHRPARIFIFIFLRISTHLLQCTVLHPLLTCAHVNSPAAEIFVINLPRHAKRFTHGSSSFSKAGREAVYTDNLMSKHFTNS